MRILAVYPDAPDALTGRLRTQQLDVPCTLGRGGIRRDKKEGDGATPAGVFVLRQGFYRADRLPEPQTGLPMRPLDPADAWCEDPAHPDYNRLVRLPHPATDTSMFRDDGLFDIVVAVGYNDDPVQAGAGSAIFIHLARENRSPTAGCIGLGRKDLLKVLKLCDSSTRLAILPEKGLFSGLSTREQEGDHEQDQS